jgi:hypothetical protein
VQQDVLRLDVAVDHAVAVRVIQRIGHLGRDLDRFLDAELLLAVELGAEGFPFDVRHDVVQEALGRAGIEEWEDVRVLERGGGLDLLDEPLGAEHGGELGFQDLDGDLAVVLQVLCEVDRGHAARAELALDAVAVGEACPEAVYRHRILTGGWCAEGAAASRAGVSVTTGRSEAGGCLVIGRSG